MSEQHHDQGRYWEHASPALVWMGDEGSGFSRKREGRLQHLQYRRASFASLRGAYHYGPCQYRSGGADRRAQAAEQPAR